MVRARGKPLLWKLLYLRIQSMAAIPKSIREEDSSLVLPLHLGRSFCLLVAGPECLSKTPEWLRRCCFSRLGQLASWQDELRSDTIIKFRC